MMRLSWFAPLFLLTALVAQQEAPPLDATTAGPAQRIWSATMLDQQELWLRRVFTMPKAAKTATLVFSCDNRCTVRINGKSVAIGDDWEKLTIVDVTESLVAGDNVLAVHAVNEGSCAAIAVWLYWQDAAGVHGEIVTGKEWRVADEEVAGWSAVKFDDSKWAAASEQGVTAFGKNVYNGEPRGLLFHGGFSQPAEALATGVDALRRARTAVEAERALEALDRAMMEARAAVWRARQAEAKAKAGKQR